VEIVEDTDVIAPYTLRLDSLRYGNGGHNFKMIAYDSLDRRGEATINFNINNAVRSPVEGNLVVDGDMEDPNTDAWVSYNGADVSKISDGRQRGDTRSLLVSKSGDTTSYTGVQQTVTGFSGGEDLRFVAWPKLISHVTTGEIFNSKIEWKLLNESSQTIESGLLNPYNFFRKVLCEFRNPAGNSEITIRFQIIETNPDAGKIEAVIDDVVLRDALYPLVEQPEDLTVIPVGNTNVLSWTGCSDINVEYYYIYRRLLSDLSAFYIKIGEVEASFTSYVDAELDGQLNEDFAYGITAVDFMGATDGDRLPDYWEFTHFGRIDLYGNNETLDTDSDNLPDYWEFRYFNTLDYDDDDNPDGDGFTNIEEYNTGTNPNNGDS